MAASIAIAVLVFIVIGLIFFRSGAWQEAEGAPKVNFQSLASGNVTPIPGAIGESYEYGYYQGNDRIGGFKGTLDGIEMFRSVECYKISLEFDMGLEMMGVEIKAIGTGHVYYEVAGLYPKHMVLSYDYTDPYEMTMTMTADWYRSSSQMVSNVTMIGISSSATAYLPSNYWDPITNITVGFAKTIEYTIASDSFSEDVELRLLVTGQEDVTVPKGDFENCYRVEVSSQSSLTALDLVIWIDDEGAIPQADMTMDMGGISVTLSMKLEHYGIQD